MSPDTTLYAAWQRVCERIIGHDWEPQWTDVGEMPNVGMVDLFAETCTICSAARLLIAPRQDA